MADTKWVATIKTDDEETVHLEASLAEIAASLVHICKEYGEPRPGQVRVEEVPKTWLCDGRDGCTVQS